MSFNSIKVQKKLNQILYRGAPDQVSLFLFCIFNWNDIMEIHQIIFWAAFAHCPFNFILFQLMFAYKSVRLCPELNQTYFLETLLHLELKWRNEDGGATTTARPPARRVLIIMRRVIELAHSHDFCAKGRMVRFHIWCGSFITRSLRCHLKFRRSPVREYADRLQSTGVVGFSLYLFLLLHLFPNEA